MPHYKRMVIPVDRHKIYQRRQRVNQIRTDHAPMRIANNYRLITSSSEGKDSMGDAFAKLNEDTKKISSSLNSAIPQQEHASLRKLVAELKNVLHEIKESPQLKKKPAATFPFGERQLTENDLMNFEDVSNSDILSAFASIKKVNEQRKEERFVHSPVMEGGEQEQSQQQEVYEPGFNSAEFKRSQIVRGAKRT